MIGIVKPIMPQQRTFETLNRKVSFVGRHFYRHMGTENKIKIIHIVARRYFLLKAYT